MALIGKNKSIVERHLQSKIFTSDTLSSLCIIAGLTCLFLITIIQSATAIPLTQAECNALGSGKVNITGNYTFICGYPFNATIPYGTNLVWIDTEQWKGKYHHTITSVNGTFNWQDQTLVIVSISKPFQINHSYKYHDELNSNETGYITIVPHNGTSSVTILDPSEVRTPDSISLIANSTGSTNSTNSTGIQQIQNNNSTPLMLPPNSVGLPPNTPWVNPNNSTSNTTSTTITPSSDTTNAQCATSADISSLTKEIRNLEERNSVLQEKITNQSNMINTIFGMLTKLLHNFNLT